MYYPLQSLREGNWFKLICGASFQHLPAVRSLTLAYALAGADCVDVAADPAVVSAAKDALQACRQLTEEAQLRGYAIKDLPWLMVSLNDGEDPHFRKAVFNPTICPPDCLRPCEKICPAQAIVFDAPRLDSPDRFSGVIQDLCYGCGRCLPICPIEQITTQSYVSTPAAIAPLVLAGVDAVEIHTQIGRWHDFKRLWEAIEPQVDQLKLIAISCPDGEGLIDYLWSLYDLIAPLPCALLWQTDGRPMSGDIGDGATRAAVKLGQKVLAAELPGYVQLAGGTNSHTVSKLEAMGLLSSANSEAPCYIAGVAYGSYARVLLSPMLEEFEQWSTEVTKSHSARSCSNEMNPVFVPPLHLEAAPDLLWQAVHRAYSLVSQLKVPMNLKQTIPK